MTTNQWWLRAACKGVDTELFDTDNLTATAARMVTFTICANCPVQRECLDDALLYEGRELSNDPAYKPSYIKGGELPLERLQMLRGLE